MKEIKFYKVSDPFGFFSNFSAHPIYLDGERWNTVEHYFQASKFESIKVKERIKSIGSPMQAAIEGRDPENIIRSDWEVIKEQVMYNALRCKFLQHPKLLKELLLTEGYLIIEHTENDNYWGDGGDGTGKNRLGILLMNVRSEIRKYVDDVSMILPPWIAFPTIDQFDMFWRMGFGEDYFMQWVQYLLSTDQMNYREKFPEPEEWEGVYE
jgi:N-glycosidase YbiA